MFKNGNFKPVYARFCDCFVVIESELLTLKIETVLLKLASLVKMDIYHLSFVTTEIIKISNAKILIHSFFRHFLKVRY